MSALRNWRTSNALGRSRSRCCLHRGHVVRRLRSQQRGAQVAPTTRVVDRHLHFAAACSARCGKTRTFRYRCSASIASLGELAGSFLSWPMRSNSLNQPVAKAALKGLPRYTYQIRSSTVVPMSNVVEEIEAKVRSLKPEEKTELLRSLIAELDGPPDSDAQRAWLEVAKRRHREIVEGKVKPVPGDEVFEKVRSRLKR